MLLLLQFVGVFLLMMLTADGWAQFAITEKSDQEKATRVAVFRTLLFVVALAAVLKGCR